MRIERVAPERTYRLRQQVLRPNLPLDQMALFGDDGEDTGIFGAVDASGELVGTANVRREQAPAGLPAYVAETTAGGGDEAAQAQWQWRLRGMATREDLRSQGIGALVLQACVDHVATRGGGLLWCNARIGARRFYARAGFVEWGEEFDSLGVRHVVMWRLVEGSG